jgi:hypothetical protein
MNFKIPPTVFFPQPKVDSALITIDFSKPHPKLNLIRKDCLRKYVYYDDDDDDDDDDEQYSSSIADSMCLICDCNDLYMLL